MPNLIFWEKPRSSFRRPLNRKTLRSSLRQSPACFAMGPPEAPQAASSIELRNCYVARFQLPPEAPQAVSIGLRNCYVARFEYPFKTSKASKVLQQLSKAFEPQNSPQQLATAPPLPLPWDLPRPHKLFLSGFETATWHVLRTPSRASKAPQQLSKASRGPTSCFYRASKLLRGTFWRPLQNFKSPAAVFEGKMPEDWCTPTISNHAGQARTPCSGVAVPTWIPKWKPLPLGWSNPGRSSSAISFCSL